MADFTGLMMADEFMVQVLREMFRWINSEIYDLSANEIIEKNEEFQGIRKCEGAFSQVPAAVIEIAFGIHVLLEFVNQSYSTSLTQENAAIATSTVLRSTTIE